MQTAHEAEPESCKRCSEVRVTRPRGLAIHTRNTVYLVDAASICVAVLDRRTGRHLRRHHLIGSLLTGSRRETPDGYDYQELPQVGWQATFQQPGAALDVGLDLQLIVTSRVLAMLPL
jgi:hypothetical protein